MENVNNKIKISNKIYPYLSGFSDDLLFWASINTIFLTTVKHFSASQVSMLTAISVFATIIFQNIVLKIIKKIGNLKSVRLGLIMLFIASLIITFGKSFVIIAIGQVIYQIAFFFRDIKSVILKRNLKYINKEDDFVKIQTKGSVIYSILTLFISLIAGYVFNINNYLPMIICSILCFGNILFSKYLYEYNSDEKIVNNNKKLKWNKTIFLIIFVFGITYATLDLAQFNGKIFIQYYLQEYISLDKTSIYLSNIIVLSRISRVISNILFTKLYKKIKYNLAIILNVLLFLSIFIMIVGSIVSSYMIGIVVIGIGFCLLLGIRDIIMNFYKNELLDNCIKEEQEKAILNFNLTLNIVKCLLAILVSIILLKFDMIYVIITLLIFVIIYTFPIMKLYSLLKKKSSR